jgi:iron uptake system EfeUOB component EfeO/EfeM
VSTRPARRLASRLALTGLVGAAVVLAGGSARATSGAAVGAGREHHLPTERIQFGEHTCAPHWYAPNKGRNRFRVQNTSHHRATVYLVRLPVGRTVATVRRSRPGTTRTLRVRLRPGRYLWGCYLAGFPPHVSETEKVPIDDTYGGPGHPVVPLSRTDIRGSYHAYRRYVASDISILGTEVSTLVSALDAGDVATAEQAWLAARLTWLRIGQDNAAYGAFGRLGRRIDGTSAGLPQGTADPHFTGFHRVELDLWAPSDLPQPDLSQAAADAETLSRLVGRLAGRPASAWLPASKSGESAWILRVHEVLEDALRDSLSGHDDYGSGSTLASVSADVDATREDLALLAPLVKARKPHLVTQVRHHLDHLTAVVTSLQTDAGWPAWNSLTAHQRERVDAAVGGALEKLAAVPSLLPIGGGT